MGATKEYGNQPPARGREKSRESWTRAGIATRSRYLARFCRSARALAAPAARRPQPFGERLGVGSAGAWSVGGTSLVIGHGCSPVLEEQPHATLPLSSTDAAGFFTLKVKGIDRANRQRRTRRRPRPRLQKTDTSGTAKHRSSARRRHRGRCVA